MIGNKCFPLLMKDMNGSALKASVEGDAWKWHKRLGHLNFNILQLLSDKEMVMGLPKLKKSTGVREGCIAGKQHKVTFNKEQTWKASKPLELVHSYICGPMQVTTFGRNIYLLIFIDDATRMCWVYLLNHKLKVFKVFKKFKVTVELQSGYKLLKIRSDRGGEYNSHEFIQFCKDLALRDS